MKMPYGKFKGKEIHEIPSGYLRWLAQNFDDEDICMEADEEYNIREQQNAHWWED